MLILAYLKCHIDQPSSGRELEGNAYSRYGITLCVSAPKSGGGSSTR